MTLGLQRYIAGLSQRLDAADLPALLLHTPERDYLAGSGSPTTTVTASAWELFRALGSRRSIGQILALPWSGDPQPYLTLLPAYGPAPTNSSSSRPPCRADLRVLGSL